MKKHLLLFLAVIFSISAFAADLNPFAYNLYSTTTINGETELHFSTNALSEKVQLFIKLGGSWKELPRNYVDIGAGNYSTIISSSDVTSLGMTYGQSYDWKVVITPPNRSGVEYVEDKRIDMPAFSIDIDNNPQSTHFGRILVSNGTNQLGNNTHGIYEYHPNLVHKGTYTGGITNSTYDWYDNHHLSPYRLRIAQDGSGRIVVSNFDVDKTVYLWHVDPNNLNSWTAVITRNTAKGMVGVDGYGKTNTYPVYNFGLDLRTNGNEYKLLLLSAGRDKETLYTYGRAYSGIYTIPNINNSFAGNYSRLEMPDPSSGYEIRNIISNALSSNAQFDKNGNVWYSGNSAYSDNKDKAGLAHQIVANGNVSEAYKSVLDFQRYTQSAGGLRHHYKGDDNRIVIAQGAGRDGVIASIYNADYSTAHPTLNRIADLKVSGKNKDTRWFVMDFAWDYANNIYVCVRNASAAYRGVHAFATDLNGTPIETPSKNNFVLSKGLEPNPYAYDLSSSWSKDTKVLTVNFTLNAAPNLNETVGPKGIQIYAIDKNENRYLVYLVPSATITSAPNGMKGPYNINIPFETLKGDDAVYRDLEGREIPKDLLTWEVTVCGRSNDDIYANRTTAPQVVKWTIDNRPYRIHGIAVNNCENSADFGNLYMTESIRDLAGLNSRYSWLSGKIPSLLEYSPQLDYLDFHKNNFNDMDPHRVRVSKDGRIFVTSHAWQASTAVWEYKNGTFKSVITGLPADKRVMSIDTKGSKDDLKLLVFYLDKTYTGTTGEGMYCYEYSLGTKESITYNSGIEKAHLQDFTTGGTQGLMYQAIKNDWYFSSVGLASAVYGPNDMIWMKLDFNTTNGANAASIHAFNSKGVKLATHKRSSPYFWGAGAILMRGDTLIVGSCQENTGVGMNGALQFYKAGTDGSISLLHNVSTANSGTEYTGLWVTDMTRDNANNLYVASSYTANVMVLALPYDGHTTTRAPQNAENQFMLGTPITWHPFHCPVEEFRNKDLWLMFMDAYNDWYKQSTTQPIVVTRADQKIEDAFLFMFNGEKENDGITHKYPDGLAKEFMTDPNSPWKWLGDYILKHTGTISAPETNAVLWEEFKPYFNKYLKEKGKTITGDQRSEKLGIQEVATFWDSNTDGELVMIGADSEFKWLGDYIIKHAGTPAVGNEIKWWRANLHAFFNQTTHNIGATTTAAITSANFAETGKPENWRPYYVSSDGNRQIDTELEWREEIHAFFNATNQCSYVNLNDQEVTVTTADYRTIGQPDQENNGVNGWFDEWWNATFDPFLLTGENLPYLRRDGYLLEGWYYGDEQGFYYLNNEDRAGDYLYNETAANGRTHLWARWIDASVKEGYTQEPDQHALDLRSYKINYNAEVVAAASQLCGKGKSVTLDVERKLQSGMYNTMMLPFAIPKKDYLLKVTDMDGTHIFDQDKGGAMPSILVYEGFETINVGGEDMLQIIFHELGDGNHDNNEDSEGRTYESILAYTPFFIQPNSNITSRMHFWPAYISEAAAIPQVGEGVSFVSHFVPNKVTVPEGASALILVAENRLAHLVGDDEMLGLRGYFLVPEALSNQPAQICVKTNSETGIKDIFVPDEAEASAYKILQKQRVLIIRENKIYDIMGNLLYEL